MRQTNTIRGEAYLAYLMEEIKRAQTKQRLREARERAGFTQAQLADLLHVHERSVQDYESLKKPVIPYDRMDEWAALTNTSAAHLLHGEDTISAERLDRLEVQIARAVELLEQLLDGNGPRASGSP